MDLNMLYRISDFEWSIPKSGSMSVDVHIIGSQNLIEKMDAALFNQAKSVAELPGLRDRIVLLPNASPSNVFPNGSVALFDPTEGRICPQAFDSNMYSGIRTITTNLIIQDIEKKAQTLIKEFCKVIPVGSSVRSKYSINKKELREVLKNGAKHLIENMGEGKHEDLESIEDSGKISGADPTFISSEAMKRENHQLGTLGSGEDYLELQVVDEVFDIERARVFGLFKNQVVVTFHTGARGFGMQTMSELLERAMSSEDKLITGEGENAILSIPFNSPIGQEYMAAIRCAGNFALANRQIIGHKIDRVFNDIIKDVDTNVMYDISHNSLREETHRIATLNHRLLVQRKGCVRNFSGKRPEVLKHFFVSGQPIIVKGAIGSYSYIMAGTEESHNRTFGSSIHNAGRAMSPQKAAESLDYASIQAELASNGIYLKSRDENFVLEESIPASNDIEEVIKSINKSNISIRVARLKPLGIVKG